MARERPGCRQRKPAWRQEGRGIGPERGPRDLPHGRMQASIAMPRGRRIKNR